MDMKHIIREALRQGWRLERTRGGHQKLIPPTGPFIIIASTDSDVRSVRNTLARMRRQGFVFPAGGARGRKAA